MTRMRWISDWRIAYSSWPTRMHSVVKCRKYTINQSILFQLSIAIRDRDLIPHSTVKISPYLYRCILRVGWDDTSRMSWDESNELASLVSSFLSSRLHWFTPLPLAKKSPGSPSTFSRNMLQKTECEQWESVTALEVSILTQIEIGCSEKKTPHANRYYKPNQGKEWFIEEKKEKVYRPAKSNES